MGYCLHLPRYHDRVASRVLGGVRGVTSITYTLLPQTYAFTYTRDHTVPLKSVLLITILSYLSLYQLFILYFIRPSAHSLLFPYPSFIPILSNPLFLPLSLSLSILSLSILLYPCLYPALYPSYIISSIPPSIRPLFSSHVPPSISDFNSRYRAETAPERT